MNELQLVLIVGGTILLGIELLVLGGTTLVITIVGVSMYITALALFFVKASPLHAFTALTIVTPIVTIVSWKPLKALQDRTSTAHVESDFANITFILKSNISPTEFGHHRYSGIEWNVKSPQTLASGTLVRVIAKEVGWLTVESVD
ncbi:NfeD family protein [Photobacterium leiognathi]|uniref:NfeD family protein n=1 Tax=Photobacterium leiognathi TaxID=553611 RepID=UPI0029825892|nr:hypothetical protein [Photobacterium leiognathi]